MSAAFKTAYVLCNQKKFTYSDIIKFLKQQNLIKIKTGERLLRPLPFYQLKTFSFLIKFKQYADRENTRRELPDGYISSHKTISYTEERRQIKFRFSTLQPPHKVCAKYYLKNTSISLTVSSRILSWRPMHLI